MIELAKLLKTTAESGGSDVEFYNGYSGRGMYGRRCVGITGNKADCMRVIGAVICELHGDAEGFYFDEAVQTLLGFDQDQMGYDVILYWQGIEELSDEEENDGQPDEAQEWHDFDPDC